MGRLDGRFLHGFRGVALLAVTAAMLVSAPMLRAEGSLYQDLGGKEGIARFVHELLKLSVKDDRIKHTFADLNIPRIEKLIVEQICDVAGGPCKYSGKDMHKSHKGHKITTMQFNALVEDLQEAMDKSGVPFHAQNRLLALLAPMKRDIVTR